MSLIENITINLIYTLFPILLYFIYSCHNSLNNNKYSKIIFNLMLFSSCYLLLKYGSGIEDSKMLLLSNVPIIMAYLMKNEKLGIVLSIFIIIYSYFVFKINVLFMVIKYIIYYIIYLIVKKKKISDNDFIWIIAIIQAFFLSFEYFYLQNINIYNIFKIFILVTTFYIITFLILYLINYINKLTNIFYEVKNLEKEKEIKNALFKLTHEIKNPIAVCKGYLDMMNINDKEKSERYIEIIKQEINRSLNIMNDFLEFSRIKIKKEIIDINVLLDDVYDNFKILNKSKNIKLKYLENDNELYINGDYERLKQVMLNIIKNSMEAIKEKGNIIISSKINNNNCYIIIEDNGSGMDTETLNNIKNLFYTTKTYGSGIGVNLSNEIIKAHGGELNYYSQLGKGTKVEIVLKLIS